MKEQTVVVMPVTQVDLAGKVMIDMQNNTVPPSRMIIIDDSDKGFTIPEEVKFEVTYWKTETWLGVNAYLNWAVTQLKNEDFVMFLNDDVTIHSRFIEMMLIGMKKYKDISVICPLQVRSLEEVGGSDDVQCEIMHRRDGLAFTFRRYVLDQVPPIPKELIMYYGEDWYWVFTAQRSYPWGRIVTSRIYHYYSLGAKQRGLKKYFSSDREAYLRIVRELGRV